MNDETESDFVPFGLYRHKKSGKGYIGLPEKVRKNGKDSLEFPEIDGLTFLEIFYALNPSITPTPWGTSLLCIEKTNLSEPTTGTVINLYDHFDIDTHPNCIRLLAWLRPVNGAVPLYITSNYEISFDKNILNGKEELDISPIYVFKTMPSGFIPFDGHCIPTLTGGIDIHDCSMLYTKRILENTDRAQPNTFPHLYATYKTKKDSDGLPSFLQVILVLLFLGFTIHLVMKK